MHGITTCAGRAHTTFHHVAYTKRAALAAIKLALSVFFGSNNRLVGLENLLWLHRDILCNLLLFADSLAALAWEITSINETSIFPAPLTPAAALQQSPKETPPYEIF